MLNEIRKLGSAILSFSKAQSPMLLAGAAVIGLGAIAVTAYRAGKKAPEALEKAEKEKGEPLTKLEHAKVAAKLAWVTALIIALTGGCIIGSVYISSKRLAVMSAAYSSAAALLEQHQAKELAVAGEEVAEKIKEEVGKEYSKALPERTKYNTDPYSRGEFLFFDDWSSRYFFSNRDKIETAFVKTYTNMLESINGEASINCLYENLEIETAGCGNDKGWTLDSYENGCNEGILKFIPYELYPGETPTGEPCMVLSFRAWDLVPF